MVIEMISRFQETFFLLQILIIMTSREDILNKTIGHNYRAGEA